MRAHACVARPVVRLLSLVLLLIVAGCGSSAAAPRTPDPRLLALRTNDLSGGFTELGHRYWTPAQLAHHTGTSVSLYERHDLIRAYESSFARLTHIGIARVADVVYQFRDQNGAKWLLQRLRTEARARGYHPFHFNVDLGDQMYSYHLHPTFNGRAGTEYVVYYRRQATVASVIGAGQADPLTNSAELVPFVGSIDLRAKKEYKTS